VYLRVSVFDFGLCVFVLDFGFVRFKVFFTFANEHSLSGRGLCLTVLWELIFSTFSGFCFVLFCGFAVLDCEQWRLQAEPCLHLGCNQAL